MCRNKTFGFALLIMILLFGGAEVYACLCNGPRNYGGKNFQPCTVYWTAEAVFIGRVDKIEKEFDGKRDYPIRLIAHFSVTKAIRGVTTSTVEVETSATSCGYKFKEGESYFAYVGKEKNGRFSESSCGATTLLIAAQKDLDYLRAVEEGEKGARVFGVFTRTMARDAQPSFVRLSEIPVTLRSIRWNDKGDKYNFLKNDYRTKTDADGFYIFYGIPKGDYLIEADIPRNLHAIKNMDDRFELPRYITVSDQRHQRVERERCAMENFTVTDRKPNR